MRAEVLKKTVVMHNDTGLFNYFGWPSVCRLPDGRIAVAASGYRLKHVCPFGKAVICFSNNECETFSAPSAVIDTFLDDRDSGLTVFGGGRTIFTSFNNTIAFQKAHNFKPSEDADEREKARFRLTEGYLDSVSCIEDAEKYLGSTYRISEDSGNTFGKIRISPVTCPHGPLALSNGELLYIGRRFSKNNLFENPERDFVEAWKLNSEDEFEFVSSIPNVTDEDGILNSCEPHAVQLPNGKIIVHIRVQRYSGKPMFTVYQSVSEDMGKTFSAPVRLLGEMGGSPAHLLILPSGRLLSVYGYREAPYGLRYMVSADDGNTWTTDQTLYDEGAGGDLGYPATIVLSDGTLFTVFYEARDGASRIYGLKWRLSE